MRSDVLRDVEVLYKHSEAAESSRAFRYISPAKEREYVFKNVQIGGKRIRRGEELLKVYAWTDVQPSSRRSSSSGRTSPRRRSARSTLPDVRLERTLRGDRSRAR